MRNLIFVLLIWFAGTHAIAQSVTVCSSDLEAYVGEDVRIYVIDDYLSQLTTQIASTTDQEDSTFKVSFFNDETRKLRIEVGKNFFHIYTQPKAKYNLFVTKSPPYIEIGRAS